MTVTRVVTARLVLSMFLLTASAVPAAEQSEAIESYGLNAFGPMCVIFDANVAFYLHQVVRSGYVGAQTEQRSGSQCLV